MLLYSLVNLCLTGLLFADAEVCNPMSCFYMLDRLFSFRDINDLCWEMKKLEKRCLSLCSVPFEEFSNDIINRSIRYMTETVCENQVDELDFPNPKILHDCMPAYKYQLLLCLYKSMTLEVDKESKLMTATGYSNPLICRKIVEAERCPQSIIPSLKCMDLGPTLEGILTSSFKPVREESCYSLDQDKVWNLEVLEDSKSIHGYEKLVKCLHQHHEAVSSCLPDRFTVNFMINKSNRKEYCLGFDSFVHCMERIVKDACNHVDSGNFLKLAFYAKEYALPYCFENTVTVNPMQMVPITVYPNVQSSVYEKTSSSHDQMSIAVKDEDADYNYTSESSVSVVHIGSVAKKLKENKASALYSGCRYLVLEGFLILLYSYFIFSWSG